MFWRWFRRNKLRLNRPRKINSDVRICFNGSGRARFRLQHAFGSEEPDELTWCDVSAVSNRRIDPLAAIGNDSLVRGVLVDVVNGHAEVEYRRHAASWIRVTPLLDEEAETCAAYKITMEPV